MTLVSQFKEMKERYALFSITILQIQLNKLFFHIFRSDITRPLKAEIEAFIDEKVAKKILSRYISATDRRLFEQARNIAIIVELVRKSFYISFDRRNIKAIKDLDILTKNMQVHSLSGRNIANNLEL